MYTAVCQRTIFNKEHRITSKEMELDKCFDLPESNDGLRV